VEDHVPGPVFSQSRDVPCHRSDCAVRGGKKNHRRLRQGGSRWRA